MKNIINKLKKIVGDEWVRTDLPTRFYYGSDSITHFSQSAIYPENHPRAIVFPESAKQIQAIVNLSGKRNIPIHPIGGGTVLLIGSIPGKPNIAITLDFHRMQKITVDKERMVVRVQPGATGIQISQLIREMDFGYRPFFGGSPGTSHFVPYHILTGQNKMAGYQDGMGINCVCGIEMVLSNGEILKTGSMTRPESPAWPHGFGPALTFLPFFANGGYGVVTEMECRFFHTPQKVSSLWVAFPTPESAVKAMYSVMRKEYGCGFAAFVSGCWTQCLYSNRHWQEGVHFLKATQDMTLVGMSFRGSSRKVSFERNACIHLLKKHRGVVMPHWMVDILDGHEENATGWQQCNSAKICSTLNGKPDSGGFLVTGAGFDSLDKLEEFMIRAMKVYQQVCRKNPEFLNHPHPNIKLYTGCGQTYLAMGGHANAAGEIIFVVDQINRNFLPLVVEIVTQFEILIKEIGMAPLGVGRDKRTWTECPPHFSMAQEIKKVFDPKGFLSPGVSFPLSE